jgi:hypothetical protein
VFLLSTTVLGATPEAQQLPKSGTGWVCRHQLNRQNGNPSAIFTRNNVGQDGQRVEDGGPAHLAI